MDNVNITAAQYKLDLGGNNGGIQATIDGIEVSIPLDKANRHYSAILKAVEAGELVIAAAEAQ